MKSVSLSTKAMAMSLLCSQVSAGPILQPRGGGWEIAAELIKLFGAAISAGKGAFATPVHAWDYKSNPNYCEVYMETKDGANCFAHVKCNDGLREYNAGKAGWNACYVGGRQYFNDPRIGDFSITFASKDGILGEGLTNPILQLKDIGNWKEIPADDLGAIKRHDEDCAAHNGVLCKDGPYICTNYEVDPEKGRTRKWLCGVPKTGMNFPGLDSNGPVNDRGYRPGWCGVHVTQYQKPDPSKDGYALEARIMDANQNEIGNSGGKQGARLSFASKLPQAFVVNSRAVDADPLDFEYNGAKWDSNSKDCKVGVYDKGKRQMDCGFTC